jgi:N-methylhydantoinase A
MSRRSRGAISSGWNSGWPTAALPKPYMMQSNGGIAAAAAKANPITMVESGPASGIYAAAHVGRAIGEPNLIVLDIGGTTAKCTLIEGGQIKVSTDYYIERDGKSPAIRCRRPFPKSSRSATAAGPSRGSMPAASSMSGRNRPARAGAGSLWARRHRPTTTDANLLLGRIDPASFVGGEVEPDWQAVDAAFAPLCDQLGLSRAELARG